MSRVLEKLRQRRATLGALLVVVVIVLIVLLASSGAGPAKPPATGAAAVVPADTLAYVHLSTDRSRSSVTRGLALAERFPGFSGARHLLFSQLGSAGSTAEADFKSGVRPWLGKEVAVAYFDTGSAAPSALVVVGVSDLAAARHFVTGLPTDGSASYEGTTITGHPGSGDTAFVGSYLLIGHSANIKAAIDVAAGHAGALSGDQSYRRASVDEPAGRALDIYLSVAGLRRLVIPAHGLLGILGALVDQPALQGLAVSLSPASGGVRVHVHSALDPQLTRAGGPTFVPTLGSAVPSGAALFFDSVGLNRSLPRVLSTIGLGARIPQLLTGLGRALSAEGVNVKQDLASLFSGEAAVIITTHGSTPVITVVTRPRDLGATRTDFAELEAPLERVLAPSGAQAGQIPLFNQVSVGGVAAHQLVISPGLQFDYAVTGSDLILSTSVQGIAGVVRHAHSILDQSGYTTALSHRPPRVTSLLFLDLNQLLRLNEQIGLISGPRFRSLAPDLDRVRTLGLDTTTGAAQSSADLFLQIP